MLKKATLDGIKLPGSETTTTLPASLVEEAIIVSELFKVTIKISITRTAATKKNNFSLTSFPLFFCFYKEKSSCHVILVSLVDLLLSCSIMMEGAKNANAKAIWN